MDLALIGGLCAELCADEEGRSDSEVPSLLDATCFTRGFVEFDICLINAVVGVAGRSDFFARALFEGI